MITMPTHVTLFGTSCFGVTLFVEVETLSDHVAWVESCHDSLRLEALQAASLKLWYGHTTHLDS